jgi:glutamate dehydrogenase (NAD(P)+)
MGGSLGMTEAMGYGVMIIVREALKELGKKVSEMTASVQGFGNVAQHAIQLFQQMGGTVTCVACWNHQDQNAYAFRKKQGIGLEELIKITNHFGEINKIQAEELGYEVLPGEAWIEQDVDILIPAALENQISSENIEKINNRVKIIAEGADRPINPEVESYLEERGITILPDILAGAGGMTCSYFEQVQSNANYHWPRSEVLGKLDRQMTSAFISVSEFAKKHQQNLRDSAYAIAVDRVAEACSYRGWV